MEEIVLESFGKINLGLDVLYKRDDGYHEINTIMQQIDLKDRIIIKNRDRGIRIQCNDENTPLDETNLVHKAWERLVERTGLNRGVHIMIDKNIPLASGLAGGSSNGAAVLRGLNELWELDLKDEELMDLGLEIGADLPFCLLGGTAWARGKGEKLTRLKSFSHKMILLANIGVPISTRRVYHKLKLNKNKAKIQIEKLAQAMEAGNLARVGGYMANIMEEVVIGDHPIIGQIKEKMKRYGALGSVMTGSGPTVIGLFDDEDKLLRSKRELEKIIERVYVAKTL